MGTPPCQQDLNGFKDPSKPVFLTRIYPYIHIMYPATFSEVLDQNRSDSSSSSRPSYLLTSSVSLCSRSFSGCLNTKVVLLHESFHLQPPFQRWFFWLHCVENQPACNRSHLFRGASTILRLPRLPVPVPDLLTVPGQGPLRVMASRQEKITTLETEETSLKTNLSQRVMRPTGAAGENGSADSYLQTRLDR